MRFLSLKEDMSITRFKEKGESLTSIGDFYIKFTKCADWVGVPELFRVTEKTSFKSAMSNRREVLYPIDYTMSRGKDS